MRVLVTGAAGFLGRHVVEAVRNQGHWVRGVDLRLWPEGGVDEFLRLDLRDEAACDEAVRGIDRVFALAADMGGMGYLAANDAKTARNNLIIDANTVECARRVGVRRLLFASSACVYPAHLQATAQARPLREDDAYPADPPDGYGWAKLMSEQLCLRYGWAYRDQGVEYRVARLHNVYGPLGSWDDGREKAPAAICRKVAVAKRTGGREIEVWGDGEQVRSFCYVDDCVSALLALMESDCDRPVNIGSPDPVRILDLVDTVGRIAGHEVAVRSVPGPQGVRGRNCDIGAVSRLLGWRPRVSLADGLCRTYTWIEDQLDRSLTRGGGAGR